MIVISGALVLVALILLVIGLVSTSLPFVYASIAVSVVSFVFLLIGILQRRNEQLPETAGETAAPARPATADVEGVTAVVPGGSRAVASEPPAAPETEDAPVSGNVLVVAGRPRYHVSGCRYLTGKDYDEVEVGAARDEGFTACGVCKPDAVLAEEAAAQPHPQPDDEVPAAEPAVVPQPRRGSVAMDKGDVPAPDPVESARKTTKATPTTAPGRTPATSTTQPAVKRAAAKAPAKKAPAKKAAAKAPSKAATAAAASTPAAASAASRPGSVVVIPDRGKFHKAECRYVRDVPDAEELSRAQAARQGYDACGVCKP